MNFAEFDRQIRAVHLRAAALLERANHVKDELLVRERRSRAAAQRLQRRQAFLAEASALLGSTLDYQQTLPSVARLAVPTLADWCVIDVIEDDRSIVRAAVAYADLSRLELAATLRRWYPPEEAHRHPALSAMRSGRPERLYGVPFALLETAIREREFLAFLRDSGMQTGVFLPLVVRGKPLGVVTLISTRSARRYGPDELAFVEDFATRIAHAVDAAQLYRQAQEANQAKADFLAVMSHELRTPLNAIVGFTELLSMGLPEAVPPGALAHVERIGAASVHLLQVIEEILVFSRLEAGRTEVLVERADVREIIRDAVALVEPLAAAKGLTLRVAEAPGEVELYTDPRKVRHVLVNLLANAIKFTERGMVTVSLHERADGVVLGVADTGIGIPREHLDRIFDPFWQGERLARRRGGTGLGLSIVRRLTELLGGTITVDSTLGV